MPGLMIDREILLEAPAEVVWRTITEPDQITQWFADRVVIEDWSKYPAGTKGVPGDWKPQNWGKATYDFAVVEVDENGLNGNDVAGFGFSWPRHRAGDDIEGQPLLRRRFRLGHEFRREFGICGDEGRPRGLACIAFLRKRPNCDPAFGIVEQDLREGGDHSEVRGDRMIGAFCVGHRSPRPSAIPPTQGN